MSDGLLFEPLPCQQIIRWTTTDDIVDKKVASIETGFGSLNALSKN